MDITQQLHLEGISVLTSLINRTHQVTIEYVYEKISANTRLKFKKNQILVCLRFVDYLKDINYSEPYTWTLIIFTFISAASIPCYYLAGKRYKEDKKALESSFSS